jgi:hypothetical protein
MIGFFPYQARIIEDVLNRDQWTQLLSVYNLENRTTITLESLQDVPFFLMNTYILPTWFFIHLQTQLRKLLPHVLKFLNYNMRHIAGTLERTNALIIACALKEKKLIGLISDAISDVPSQKLFDPLRHSA